MGEFGFITGDGVYHITVYATDENGNFKILKMKNIKIGLPMDKVMTPIPGVPGSKPQKVHEKKPDPIKSTVINGKPGCGGCVVPTTAIPEREHTGKNPPISGSPIGNVHGAIMKPQTDNRFGSTKKPPVFVSTPTSLKQTKPFSSFISTTSSSKENSPNNKIPAGLTKPGLLESTNNKRPGIKDQNTLTQPENKIPGKLPEKFQNNLTQNPTPQDLMALLYKFNYTLNFHGHHESGDRAGNKKGGFFFNGRDGFARDVKYIANEFGFQPNITLRELGLNSEDTPKEETEKILNKLKGYEFKWFYER